MEVFVGAHFISLWKLVEFEFGWIKKMQKQKKSGKIQLSKKTENYTSIEEHA